MNIRAAISRINKELTTSNIIRHSLVMVVFIGLSNIFTYLYQVAMGILLDPAQYGSLFSLHSVGAIVLILSQTIRTSITKFASKYKAKDKLDKVNYLWRSSLKITTLVGLGLFILLAGLSPVISKFLNIESNWYIVIYFSSLIITFSLPASNGILLALEKFYQAGFCQSLLSFSRLLFGVILVYAGFGIVGGLAAVPLAYVITSFVAIFFVRRLVGRETEKFKVGGIFSYTNLTFLAFACFTVSTQIDVILVKHYFSPESAGYYSAASVIGKAALYASMGIVMAMFPKTSELFETQQDPRPILSKVLPMTFLLGGGVLAIYWLWSDSIIDLIFGSEYATSAPYLFRYGLSMFLFAVAFVMINYLLSLNRTGVAYAILIVPLLEIALIIFRHSSINDVVNVMVISGAVCIATIFPFFLKKQKNSLKQLRE